MNVLVYAGPGTTSELVKHAVDLLRHHLLPYYAVVTVLEDALVNDPWMYKTACLVVPGGADLPYVKLLLGVGNKKIDDYVRKGGKYLGLCAGGYYATKRVEFEVGTPLEVSGPRDLKFFPGTCRGGAYRGFEYGTHRGAKVVELTLAIGGLDRVSQYYNGGGVFVDASRYRNVEILAQYPPDIDVEDGDGSRAAVVHCKVNKGDVILTGTHPEFSLAWLEGVFGAQLTPHERDRKVFMKAMLERLGLKVNEDIDAQPPQLTPIYVTGPQAPQVLQTIVANCDVSADGIHQDDTNRFQFSTAPVLMEGDSQELVNFVFPEELPNDRSTPYFSVRKFQAALDELRGGQQLDVGLAVGYGEVVTSTNTLMDGNRQWLKYLPHGFTLTATAQVAGRGRGGNVWINPRGVMATSVLFKVSGDIPNIHNHIVTLQYLCGLALIEAILGYGDGYEDMPVRLKWPNDIYILKPQHYSDVKDRDDVSSTVEGDDEKWAKLLGAIVNSQHIDGTYNLVWGAGVNVSNEAPTTSLNQVLAQLNRLRQRQGLAPLAPYNHEMLLAKVLYTVDQYYKVFATQGLRPFLDLYYKRWFHLQQSVLLVVDGQFVKVVIEGITPDYGCLVARDVNLGHRYELQPDGNSFDIFKGLVYKKTA